MKESRYFYVPEAATAGRLPDDEATHALRVLRLKAGDEIFLIDGKGTFYRALVTVTSAKHCGYEVVELLPQKPVWRGRIHLAVAPTKMMERMEWLVEKATEIGFDEVTFLDCRFSERRVVKTARVEKVVAAAVKQSRKAWMPVVNGMTDFETFVGMPRGGAKYIAHCYDEVPRRDFFEALCQRMAGNADGEEVTVLVGPEGDFSIDEVRLAVSNGYEPVSLGECRLRTETAALAAVMMAQLNLRLPPGQ